MLAFEKPELGDSQKRDSGSSKSVALAGTEMGERILEARNKADKNWDRYEDWYADRSDATGKAVPRGPGAPPVELDPEKLNRLGLIQVPKKVKSGEGNPYHHEHGCCTTGGGQCPPVEWSNRRKREYIQFCTKVVNELRGTSAILEAEFEAAKKIALLSAAD
jgi:hypothetical protein